MTDEQVKEFMAKEATNLVIGSSLKRPICDDIIDSYTAMTSASDKYAADKARFDFEKNVIEYQKMKVEGLL